MFFYFVLIEIDSIAKKKEIIKYYIKMPYNFWIKRVSFNNHPIELNQSVSESFISDSRLKPIEIHINYKLEPESLPDDLYSRIDQINETISQQKSNIKSVSLLKEVEIKENQLKEKLFNILADYLSKRNQTKMLINELDSALDELNLFIVSPRKNKSKEINFL